MPLRSTLIALSILMCAPATDVALAGKFNKVLSVGDQAPDWSELVGTDDKPHALADYREPKLVMQVFLSNICPVAIAYEDRIVALQEEYGPKGVQVIAINVHTEEADRLPAMKLRAEEKGFNFPYVSDPSQRVGRAYGATVTPQVFLLDAERKVIYMGAFDDNINVEDATKPYLHDAIKAALAGTTPPTVETRQKGCAIEYGPAVTVETADKAAYDSLLVKHRGKVVLVDFWATWCLPCTKQFPHTVELSKKYGEEGLAVVSISLDDEDARDQVLPFLRKHEATFDNLISSYGGGDESFELFDLDGGSVPHYKLYDREGKLVRKFFSDPTADKQYTSEDIEAAVKAELAK